MRTTAVGSAIRAASLGLAFALIFAWLTPAESGELPKIQATLASVNGPEFITARAEMLFAKKVREKTNGGLSINVVLAGALGGMKETLEAIADGNLQFSQATNSSLGALYGGTLLFDLPFLFRDNDHMRRVVRGPIGQQVYAELEKRTGIKMLMAGMADGPRSVYNNRRPVRVVADLKGMKLRVPEALVTIDTFKALGAITTPMAYPEVYMAAKQGVIDGAETPLSALLDIRAPEVAKYYSLTKHNDTPVGVGVNAKWFGGLPKAYQDAIMEAGNEARLWHDSEFETICAAALAEAKRMGMQVNDIADIEEFRKAVEPVYAKYADRVGGRKLIQAVIDTK